MKNMCWIIWVYPLDWNWKDSWQQAIDLLRWNKNRGQSWYWLSILLDTWEIETLKFEELNKEIQERIEEMKWNIVWIIWHARYPTSWWDVEWSSEYIQPFELTYLKHWMAFAFNWNIVNTEELAIELEESEWIIIKRPILDTNVLKYMILSKVKSWETDLNKILEYINNKIDWSCNIVLLSKDWNFAFSKDRWWFRPLSWEIKDWTLMVSSESSALFKVWWDDKPNFVSAWEIVKVEWDSKKITEWKLNLEEGVDESSCFFESVYFADPRTILWWKPSNLHRYRLGRELAKNEIENFNPDDTVVIDIPSSSLYSAQWYSQTLDIPLLSSAITKNPGSWRTFIDDNLSREEKIRAKYIFNPNLKKYIKWKRVILIDDSVVRWSTMKHLVKDFFNYYEAKDIHLRIPSPPITSPCYYWINIANIDELIVRKFFKDINNPTEIELDELSKNFWANSLRYISVGWLIKAIRVETKQLCLACINSEYPTQYWIEKYQEQLIEYEKK